MKITKKAAVTASDNMEEVAATVPADDTAQVNDMVLEDARSHINSAIKCLGGYARRTGDPKAKEAIANLGVVLLDLQ